MSKLLLASAASCVVMIASPTFAATPSYGYSNSWFSQINLTSTVQTQSNGGAGIIISLVDTGIVASNPEVAGRVSSLSSCAAVSFKCSNGVYDDNGHGTATASIAAGVYNSLDLMSGVAPKATILAEKVLNASGSGTDADVANGITKAANGGAQVISLSLTYIPTPTIVAAINYAASKNAVIVWAGGNSNGPLNNSANTTGLSAAAMSRLIVVGSVSAANTRSSFSNTPGAGALVSGTTKASYASVWLMAPGENIVAPGVQYGSNVYAYWSGTSMSTPEVAGAVALLEATWPVLTRNGTAASVLLSTATDLGAKGVDTTYGSGLLNLDAAFKPVGSLSAALANGSMITVGTAASGVTASPALGSLPNIQSQLTNYTLFDGYLRNFTFNLSGLITSQSSVKTASASPLSTPVVSSSTRLANGDRLSVAASQAQGLDRFGEAHNRRELASVLAGPADPDVFVVSLASPTGNMTSFGKGLSSTASFQGALWGDGAAAGYQAQQLGVSSALMDLAQGGYFFSVGHRFGDRLRLAAAWNTSPAPQDWTLVSAGRQQQAASVSLGATVKLTSRVTVALTGSTLNERNGLLGSAYDGQGAFSLGQDHASRSLAASVAVDLGHGLSLLADATSTRTSGSEQSRGVISQVSAMTARAYGLSLVQSDALQRGDLVGLSLRKPLRVTAGTAVMAMTSVDADGYPVTSLTQVSLRPGGDETDIGVSYAARLRFGANVSGGLTYRSDANNVRGLRDVAARLAFGARF